MQAISLYHPEVVDRISFLIVDNHPQGTAATDIEALDGLLPTVRYTATTPPGRSRVTTAPGPTTVSLPIVTHGHR
jgi:hypothetical protein